MTHIAVILAITAAVIVLCVLCGGISSKAGLPVLLLFIFVGMLFGSDGLVSLEFDNFEFAEQICTVAMVFIIFYGGFGAKWSEAKKVAVPSLALSCAGTLITAGLTTLFCHSVLGFEMTRSLLIGAVLSSTDAASVFGVLRSKNLNLKYNTASMLELESGSNDPWAYMLTAIILSAAKGEGLSAGRIVLMVLSQVVFGVAVGAGAALIVKKILSAKKTRSGDSGTLILISAALLSFSLPILINGNGFLSCYITGLILGNSDIADKSRIVHFFDGWAGLMQIALFFLLGLLSTPSQLPKVILPALSIALVLGFVIRPVASAVTLLPFRAKLNQIAAVSFAGLRGAASIVFAIMATVGLGDGGSEIFNIVFCSVLFSIGIQGTLLPKAAEKLKMLEDGDVMKTFTDYSNETKIQFIKLKIKQGNPWIGKEIRDISLPPETLLVMIMRGERVVIPRGATTLCEGDAAILSAIGYEGQHEELLPLTEEKITPTHEWAGRTIAEAIPSNVLAVMIKRSGKTIVPNGGSLILSGDVLVIHTADEELIGV